MIWEGRSCTGGTGLAFSVNLEPFRAGSADIPLCSAGRRGQVLQSDLQSPSAHLRNGAYVPEQCSEEPQQRGSLARDPECWGEATVGSLKLEACARECAKQGGCIGLGCLLTWWSAWAQGSLRVLMPEAASGGTSRWIPAMPPGRSGLNSVL